MPLNFSALSPAFSWLRRTYRPTDQEVDTYAHLIAHHEGYPSETSSSRLLEEAELQLWVWRNELRKRPARRRTTAS